MKKISGVIMDWAGTAVDYGCFAPLNAFLKVFSEEKGISGTLTSLTGRPVTDGSLEDRSYQGDLEYAGGEREVPCLV